MEHHALKCLQAISEELGPFPNPVAFKKLHQQLLVELGTLRSDDAGFVLPQDEVNLDWLGRDPLLNAEALAVKGGFLFPPQVHFFGLVSSIQPVELDEPCSQFEFEPQVDCWFVLAWYFEIAVELACDGFVPRKVWEGAENVLSSLCLDLDLKVDEVMFDEHECQPHSQL